MFDEALNFSFISTYINGKYYIRHILFFKVGDNNNSTITHLLRFIYCKFLLRSTPALQILKTIMICWEYFFVQMMSFIVVIPIY